METVIPGKPTTTEELLPPVETTIFEDGHSKATYWVGRVAALDEIYYPDEYQATKILRANVYIDEMSFLPPDARQEDGGELDGDDRRSIHFAILENTDPTPRAVGTSRLIIKRDSNDLLPVEQHYPEVFLKQPAETGSVEASRFIARHPNRATQHLISLAGIRAMDLHANAMEAPSVYAVIEEKLARLFTKINLPFVQLSEVKSLESYNNTDNMAIRIEPKAVPQGISDGIIGPSFFGNGTQKKLGLGHFNEWLIRHVE